MTLELAAQEPKEPTREEKFRGILEDVILFVENFAPYCKDPKDLVGIAQHALVNEGQLNLLMAVISSRKKT